MTIIFVEVGRQDLLKLLPKTKLAPITGSSIGSGRYTYIRHGIFERKKNENVNHTRVSREMEDFVEAHLCKLRADSSIARASRL